MKTRVGAILLAAATASFLAASTAFARFGKGSHPKSGEITVIYPSKIANGPELKPGTYKVEVNDHTSSPQVAFYQDGKLVAQVPAKLVDQGKKLDTTQVYYDTVGNDRVITQIDLQGWTQKVMFGSSSSGATS
jgi:hypothetical protein